MSARTGRWTWMGVVAAPLALGLAGCGKGSGDLWLTLNPLQRQVPELREGLKAYGENKWADAETHFEAANEQLPTSVGHFDSGSALYKQEKYADSLDDFRKVLDTNDEDMKERAYFDMGNVQAKSGNLEEAKTNYRRALELRPNDVAARYNLEWVQRTQEEQKKKQQQSDHGKQSNDKSQQNASQDQKKDEQKKGPEEAKNDQKDQKKDDKDKQGSKKDQGQQQAQNSQKQDGQQQQQQGQQQQQDQKDADGQKQQEQQAQQQNGNDGQDKQQQGQQQAQQMQMAQADPNAPKRPLSQAETAAVLNALQADEHSLQMWKFQQDKDRQNAQRSTSDKPW